MELRIEVDQTVIASLEMVKCLRRLAKTWSMDIISLWMRVLWAGWSSHELIRRVGVIWFISGVSVVEGTNARNIIGLGFCIDGAGKCIVGKGLCLGLEFIVGTRNSMTSVLTFLRLQTRVAFNDNPKGSSFSLSLSKNGQLLKK